MLWSAVPLPLYGSGPVCHDDGAGTGGKYVSGHADAEYLGLRDIVCRADDDIKLAQPRFDVCLGAAGVEDLDAAGEGKGLPCQQGVVPIDEQCVRTGDSLPGSWVESRFTGSGAGRDDLSLIHI